MEKFPILYNGDFSLQWKVHYVFLKIHGIGPSNMCIHFEKNRLRIDDFRKSEKNRMFSLTSRSAKTDRQTDRGDQYTL